MMDDRQAELLLEKLDDIIRLLGLTLADPPEPMLTFVDEEEDCSHQNVTITSAPQGSVTRCDDCGEVAGKSKNRKK